MTAPPRLDQTSTNTLPVGPFHISIQSRELTRLELVTSISTAPIGALTPRRFTGNRADGALGSLWASRHEKYLALPQRSIARIASTRRW